MKSVILLFFLSGCVSAEVHETCGEFECKPKEKQTFFIWDLMPIEAPPDSPGFGRGFPPPGI